MAVSRPVLLALLGAVLVAGVFFATMAGQAKNHDDTQPPAPATDRPANSTEPAAQAKNPAVPKDSPARAKQKPKPAASAGVPTAVLRALERKRTVVLFFRQRGSADDDATARAVASLRGRRGLAVFSAPLSRLADYRAIAGQAGVSQAPAVVVIGRKGDARLIEGFVDRETLAQEVADSR